MIDEWSKFKTWVVLEYFLLNPDTQVHVNELSRRLRIGTYTAHRVCTHYYEDKLFNKEKIGNLYNYSLRKNDSRALALKRFMGPYLVSDKKYLEPFLKKNKNVLSIAIYGSFANGEYGDYSDLDIFVLKANEKRIDPSALSAIELKLGRNIAVIEIPLAKWREMERKKKTLFSTIKKNNILIWGRKI